MDFDIDGVKDYIKEHPKVAIGAAAGGAGIVFFSLRQKRKAEEEATAQPDSRYGGVPGEVSSVDMPLGSPSQLANYPQLIVNVPESKTPSSSQQPPRSLAKIFRGGKQIAVTAAPSGFCPPGYIAAQQPGQPMRCTLVSGEPKKGQRLSFIPSAGETAFVK